MQQIPSKTLYSAGGVAFRRRGDVVEVALISVGWNSRWQLPKGMINPGESREIAAMREVREEAGLQTELIAQISQIDYWYFSKDNGEQVYVHKFVFFFLLHYTGGNVTDHDNEVNEARWVEIEQAQQMLSFDGEREILTHAHTMITAL